MKRLQPKLVSFAQIKMSLPSLTVDERTKLVQWCNASGVTKPKLRTTDPDDWFADAVKQWLIKQGMPEKEAHFDVMKEAAAIKAFDYYEESSAMRKRLAAVARVKDRGDLVHLGNLVVTALCFKFQGTYLAPTIVEELINYHVPLDTIERIESLFGNRPVDAGRLLRSVPWVEEAIEHQLPGYMSAGMLRLAMPR